MKKLLSLLIGGAIFFGFATPSVKAVDGGEIFAEYGASIDAENGKLLYDKKANEQAYPASITKVLTAILVSENLKDSDEIYASAEAVKQDPSNQVFLLQEGETMNKKDALMAMMILSSNDVTYAIAEKIAGSVENFAEMMNQKAKEIGAVNSHFVTPNGLHNPEHYTTAYDMALIGREAMKYPEVMDAMAAQEAVIKTNQREVKIEVKNKIQEYNPNAIGGKTGYTNAAQNTLLEILEKDGEQIVSVVMKTTLQKEYKDIEAMSQIAFERLTLEPYIQKGDLIEKASLNNKDLGLVASEDVKIAKIGDEATNITTQVKLDESVEGVKEGQKVGTLTVLNNGHPVKEIQLTSDRDITVKDSKKNKAAESEEGGGGFSTLMIALLIPLATYIILNVISNIRRLKKVKRGEY